MRAQEMICEKSLWSPLMHLLTEDLNLSKLRIKQRMLRITSLQDKYLGINVKLSFCRTV